jgi:hypothetical protein
MNVKFPEYESNFTTTNCANPRTKEFSISLFQAIEEVPSFDRRFVFNIAYNVYSNGMVKIFTIKLKRKIWKVAVFARCVIQSVEFPLLGSLNFPEIKNRSSHSSSTHYWRLAK